MSRLMIVKRGGIGGWFAEAVLGGLQRVKLMEEEFYETELERGADPPVEYGELSKQFFSEVQWVYSCVSAISEFGASIDFKLYTVPPGKGRDRKVPLPENHPAVQLMREVNPVHTWFDLWEATFAYLELNGNCYWLKVYDGGTYPVELWVLSPWRVKIIPGKSRLVEGYMYTDRKGNRYQLKPEEVVHFKRFNPYDMLYGQSTLTAARRAIYGDVEAQGYNQGFLKNQARPGGFLKTKYELTDKQIKLLKKEWDKAHRGSPRAGGVAVLSGDIEWQDMGLSQKDMEFIALRKMNREEILGVFRMPPVMVSLLEHVNYATAETQRKQFALYTMMPKLKKVEATASQFLFGEFGPAIFGNFDVSEVEAFRENEDIKSQVGERLTRSGLWKINEARSRLWGMDEVPWGDTYLVPMSMISAESAAEGVTPVSAGGTPGEVVGGEGVKGLRVEGEVTRRRRWAVYARRYDGTLKVVRKVMKGMFTAQEEAVMKSLEELRGRRQEEDEEDDEGLGPGVSGIEWVDQEEMYEIGRKASRIALLAILKMALDHGKEGLPEGIGLEFGWDSPVLVEYLAKHSMELVTDLNGTTMKMIDRGVFEALQKAAADGVGKSDTLEMIRNALSEVFDGRRGNVDTIARTEVQRGVQTTQMGMWKESGVVEKKGWISSDDEVTRDEHRELDGEEVPIDEPYPIIDVMFPGDPEGEPEDVINCRCDQYAVVSQKAVLEKMIRGWNLEERKS